jgi:hypothetical protein
MKKTVTETVTEDRWYCDACKEETERPCNCVMCKMMLCRECAYHDYSDGGDYPDFYCVPCWDVGKTYRDAEQKEEEAHDERIEAIHAQWLAACDRRVTGR